ncbi:MAG: hypothetical protein KKI12_11510 [Proteobacteria bacterium]|nr:hypothetical protein [Pseudomonadota bacterium]
MNLVHELFTDEIKAEIRKSIKERSQLPGLVFMEFENDLPVIVNWKEENNVITNKGSAKRVLRFCGDSIEEDQAEEYIHWFSGVIFGMLVGDG